MSLRVGTGRHSGQEGAGGAANGEGLSVVETLVAAL